MPKTLLLADDSITIQRVVGIIFASEDYSVTTVDNGEDALSRVRELRPDILLADAVMPRKNGYELCEAVKNDPELSATPVLLLAGTFEAFDEARARAAGADGWIQKPFESSALVGKVREIVEGIAPPAAPVQPWATPAATAPAATIPPPPPRGAPLPPGARPLPGAAPSPFAAPSQPATPPRPPPPPPAPPSPFAARPAVPPVPPPPPPFAARPPQPPAPPPPPPPATAPSFRDPGPTFSAPRPPPAASAPSFSAPAPVVVPFPPPPPVADLEPEPIAELAPETGDELTPPPVELAPPPPAPPAAPAIPTQKLAQAVEVDAELDFDIDEAAAPIDLEDLAAEEITDDEALLGGESRAEVEPLPAYDLLGEESRTPPPLDLGRDEGMASLELEPTLEPEPDSEPLLEAEPVLDAEPEPEPGLEAQPEPTLALEPESAFDEQPKPFETPSFEPFRTEPDPRPFFAAAEREPVEPFAPPAEEALPFRVEPAPEPEPVAEPAREILAAATAAGAADELAAPPPIAAAADEAVLREVLSRASRETIERVVWEVVPQLAETIIREHLEQLVRDRKNL